jgi:hypothetical protein
MCFFLLLEREDKKPQFIAGTSINALFTALLFKFFVFKYSAVHNTFTTIQYTTQVLITNALHHDSDCGSSWPITFTQPQLPGIKVGQHRNLLHTIPSSVFRRAAKQPNPAKNEIGKLVNSYLIKYKVNLLF